MTKEPPLVDPDPRPNVRWRAVASRAWPLVVVLVLAASVYAIEPWLSLVPRDLGRLWTERFLRSILIVYPGLLCLIPLGFAASAWRLVRSRRRGRRAPRAARICLLSGSAALSLTALEVLAAAWLAWEHRMPALPTRFPEPKGLKDELSLVVIGGSSAVGYPYNPTLSIGQIVAWRIERALPGKKVVLDIRARLGQNTETMHLGLANLERRPDIMIIYSGHNEFLSRYEHSRDAGYREAPEGAFLNQLYRLSLHSPLCVLTYEAVARHRLGGPPPRLNRHRMIDAPACTPSEYLERMTDFRLRLDALAAYCRQVGAVAVMIIDPSNESGFEPNRTVFSAPPTPERREELTARFDRARESETASPLESEGLYRALLREAPEFAEAHFRLGRLLERARKFDEAREHFIRARDLDGFPVRCTSEMAGAYRDAAARHGSILVDGPAVLRERSRHGILDDELFHDAHHPSFAAQVGLAQAIMDDLYRRKDFGLGADGSPAPIIDPAACAAHFNVNADTWLGALIRASAYFNHLAAARYDPSERRAKHRRLSEAAEQVHAGRIKPEDAGIPGIGLPPPASFPNDWWAAGSSEGRAEYHAHVGPP
jgi:hypothetical protein